MEINSNLSLPDGEMKFTFVRASGPGGQNINKVASAAQLRFDLRSSASLSEEVKERLARLAGKRMNSDGVLVIEARRYREQERNRVDAEQRLAVLIRKALVVPQPRHATRPTRASKARRLETKKRHAATKLQRQRKSFDPD